MTTSVPIQFTPPITSRDHVRGPASAVVTLLEYGDYKCPRCNEARFVVRRLRDGPGRPDALRGSQLPLVQP